MELKLNIVRPRKRRHLCDVYADGKQYFRLDVSALEKLEFDCDNDQLLVAWVSKVVYFAKRASQGNMGYRLNKKANGTGTLSSKQVFYDTKLPAGEYELVNPFNQDGETWWGLKKKND